MPGKDATKGYSGIGMITNLMAIDTPRIGYVVGSLYLAYTTPISIAIATYYLYKLMGWSCLVGMAVIIISIPVNTLVQKQYSKVQERLMAARDNRVTLTNECLQAIRTIKFFAWEQSITDHIMEARHIELQKLVSLFFVNAASVILWIFSPLLVTALAFFSFTFLAKHELTAAIVFPGIALFERLRFPLTVLPGVLMDIAKARVSLRRMEQFLQEDEVRFSIDFEGISDDNLEEFNDEVDKKIGFKNATFQWHTGITAEDGKPVLPLNYAI
ncbi:hypothetical protein Unana1_02478 [Umbelopsis nana]